MRQKELRLDRPRLDRPPAAPKKQLLAAAQAPALTQALKIRQKLHNSKRSRCPNCAEYQDRMGYILAENNHVREENRILRRKLSDYYGHRLDYEIPLNEYERSEPKENRTHDDEQFAPSGPAATA